jgi:hypothetical protein
MARKRIPETNTSGRSSTLSAAFEGAPHVEHLFALLRAQRLRRRLRHRLAAGWTLGLGLVGSRRSFLPGFPSYRARPSATHAPPMPISAAGIGSRHR